MIGIQSCQPTCYVFDTSSLIQLEKSQGLQCMPDYPGKWLVIPSKVAKELNIEGAPKKTKDWLNNGNFATFSVNGEKSLFIKIRVKETLLHDADIQGIVIAYHRKGTYVVEEGRARRVAKSLGIRTINSSEFILKIKPTLL